MPISPVFSEGDCQALTNSTCRAVPSVIRARKRNSGVFVIWILHSVTEQPEAFREGQLLDLYTSSLLGRSGHSPTPIRE